MKLDKKKVSETCKTILSLADLDTITEKKIRRQVEEELGLEDKILERDPYKGIVKEIINKIINDLEQKSKSSCSPPQVSQAKKTDSRAETTTKPTSNKKSRKTEAISKEPSKVLEDDLPDSKPLNNEARSKVSKQESLLISKTQADEAQNKVSKIYRESIKASSSSKLTNREEQSSKTEDISRADDNKSSSSSRPAKSNVTSKSTKKTGQSNKFKEELESALPTKRTTKGSEANNEEKQKPNVSRSRVKRKVNVSSDIDDDESDSVPVSTANRPKQINVGTSDEDEEPSSKRPAKEKSIEEGQSYRKIDTVEDGGVMMALENKLLAQNLDIMGANPVLSGDDIESDNTIKEEDDRESKRTPEPEREESRTSQNNSKVEVKQEPGRLKAEPISPKRTIDSIEDRDDESSLSSLEDDVPQKKRKTGKTSIKSANIKSVDNKPVKDKLVKDKLVKGKSVNHKSVNTKATVEKNDKKIESLKSSIRKCGVRKNWTKEFADCDTDSSKIKKLRKILADLGVEGRPTLEKCRKAKKNLELQAELKAMDVDNIISDDIKETRKTRASRGIINPVRRQVSRVTRRSSPEYDDSSSEDHSDFE